MATKVAQMTAEELRDLIGAAVEQKLVELFGDPDEDLELTDALRRQLLRQKKAVAQGERGEAFEEVTARRGLG